MLVILVDENDRRIGVEEKLRAHVEGKLHRAFSVFLFNSKKEMLLQRRALEKYHSAGLWSNACCSHPRPGETTATAAKRRLREEMGVQCDLKKAFDFTYRAELANGLIEHELDHVFVGQYEGSVRPAPEEVMAWRWITVDEIASDIQAAPERYTVWFKIVLEKVLHGFSC